MYNKDMNETYSIVGLYNKIFKKCWYTFFDKLNHEIKYIYLYCGNKVITLLCLNN